MKQKVIFAALASLALFFSGCSKKMPVALPSNPQPAVESGSLNGSIAPEGSSTGLSGSTNGKNVFQKGKISGKGKYLGSDGVSKSGYKMLYFASDAYTLDDDQIKRLMSDIPKIKAFVTHGRVLVEGNCDEFGTDEYNYALGLKRAKAVKTLLESAGIESSKIDTVSYGESNPTCTVEAPACHAKNRRVEINKL